MGITMELWGKELKDAGHGEFQDGRSHDHGGGAVVQRHAWPQPPGTSCV